LTLTDEMTPQAREQEASLPAAPPAEDAVTTRRGFLGHAGRKAFYATPVVMTLAAQQAAAASGPLCGSNFKHKIGSPCSTDGTRKDCCPEDYDHQPLVCEDASMTCQRPP
jgi:hypothetical protein